MRCFKQLGKISFWNFKTQNFNRNTAAPIPLGLLEGEEEKIITKDDEQDQAEEEEEEELLDDRLLDEGEEEGEGEDVSMFSNLDSIQNSFVNNLDGGQDVFFEVRSPTQTEQNSIIGDEEMEE